MAEKIVVQNNVLFVAVKAFGTGSTRRLLKHNDYLQYNCYNIANCKLCKSGRVTLKLLNLKSKPLTELIPSCRLSFWQFKLNVFIKMNDSNEFKANVCSYADSHPYSMKCVQSSDFTVFPSTSLADGAAASVCCSGRGASRWSHTSELL